jgi:hypothetical protein
MKAGLPHGSRFLERVQHLIDHHPDMSRAPAGVMGDL